jgi:ADP-ribose pyrophosphatase YjhB (NUDIX family)
MRDRRSYALIVRKGRALLVRNERGNWTLPGGRAKQGEKLRAAVKREVKEETGLKIRLERRMPGDHIRRHVRACHRCVVFEASIKKGKPSPRREIAEVAWVKLDKVPKRLRAFRRKRLRKVIAARRT